MTHWSVALNHWDYSEQIARSITNAYLRIVNILGIE